MTGGTVKTRRTPSRSETESALKTVRVLKDASLRDCRIDLFVPSVESEAFREIIPGLA
jgi:hypothetical protein